MIQFLSECLVNLLRGELQELRKVDVIKYRREISELTKRRTSLHKRRTILNSPKGLQLIPLITPFEKPKLEPKQEKEESVPKDFDSIYSAVNARLRTSNNKNLLDLILNSPRIKLSQSDNIILDNRDTIVDFVCALKRKNTDFPDIYLTILEAA